MIKHVALWIARLELLILVILAPFLIFPSAGRSLALLGIPLIWTARKITRSRFIRRTPLDWAIALLLLMVLVSLYATYSIVISLPRITIVILGVAVYYAVVEVVQSPVALRWASAIYLTTGAGLAGLAVMGMQAEYKLPVLGKLVSLLPHVVRGISQNPEGLNPNIVAGALLWFIPLGMTLAVWLWHARAGRLNRTRLAQVTFVGVLGCLGVLLLTQSRGGFIGLGVGVLFLVAMTGRLGKVLVGLAVIAAVIGLVVIGPGKIGDIMVGVGSATAQRLGVETLSGRVEVWSRALYAIQDFPFTGMGMGTFGYVIPVLYPLFLISPDVMISHAHDEFLQVAVDLGLPGLVAFLAIYLAVVWTQITVWRRDQDPFRRTVALGLLVGLTSHAVFGLSDAVLLGAKPSVFWWALLGLAVATFLLAEQDQFNHAMPTRDLVHHD